MKKSINLWAFPYPQKMSLVQCLQLAKDAGFDGIELNYDLESDLSPKAGTREFQEIRRAADRIGIAVSGLCSFLFWPFPLTSNDPAKRARGLELADRMAHAAHDLGVENLLVVPGAVHIPWRDDHEPVPNDVCDRRARDAVGDPGENRREAEGLAQYREHLLQRLSHDADGDERLRRQLRAAPRSACTSTPATSCFSSIPNTGFPSSASASPIPTSRSSPRKAPTTRWNHSGHCSTAPPIGRRSWKRSTATGYRGYCTFEYFHPYAHYPEALIYQTSDSLDRMLGRKGAVASPSAAPPRGRSIHGSRRWRPRISRRSGPSPARDRY